MIIPIGININNIAAKVAKYLFRMYLSIIVNIIFLHIGYWALVAKT
jgi:sensor histidine kinase regulating citrate/malate metabolism